MKTARARRARATLLAILLPALLVAACGNGGSQASGAMAPADPSPAASDAPTGGPFQPVAIPVEPVLPDSSDPPALDELGPGPGPVAPMAVQVRTGEQATVETPIGSRGGTVTTPGGTRLVFQAGSPADGTKVIVNDLKTIDLTGAGGAPLPIALKPVSLTEVDLGGVEPTLPVVMTIPVTLGPDEVALAGHFDPATGALEPLTLLASDAASITVAVTRFPAVLTFIVPLGPLPDVVHSGVRPGRDDWQFPNYGSSVAPRGFCAGATAPELWYYNQRRVSGGSPLFGLYDNDGGTRTPRFWQDDADGIKLATMVQGDFSSHWKAGAAALVDGTGSASPTSTFAAFRGWLALTSAPQLAYVSATSGEAHAMLVYRVSATRLLVADPNMPGRLRWIDFDSASGTFKPYVAGTKVDGTPLAFNRVAFMALDLLVSPDELAGRWNEFEAGTIGDDVFTDEVPDLVGFTATGDIESLGALSPSMDVPATREKVGLAYTSSGRASSWGFWLAKDARMFAGNTAVTLQIGDNPLGVVLYEGQPVYDTSLWAGYERFTVIRGEAVPSPTASYAEPVRITINATVPIGGDGDTSSCPAEVTLSFTPTGGDPASTGAARLAAAAGLWATCTNAAFSAIDAAGTFDGHTFALAYGQWSYTGTFDGRTATITGRGGTLVFPVGP